jgi:Fe-S cluster biogenesis protein NfuA
VRAAPGAEWRDLKPQVLSALLDHFSSGAPLFRPATAGGISIAEAEIPGDPEDAEVVAQIRELIETRVRPAVAQDGGDIVYRGYRKGTVWIEGLLKHYVPEVESVEAV